LSNYQCDFISTVDKTVIFSTGVRTVRSPTADSTASLSSNPQVTGRPGSPITTLKTSIATADVKLTEERNRQRRERKEQRAKLNSARKEIDKLTNNISSSGGNDDKQRAKLQQCSQLMKQAEDAVLALTAEIEELETIPSDDTSLHSSSKREFHSQRETHKQHRTEFDATKLAIDRELQALKNELSSLQQKRERYETRITQLNERRERITDANAKGLDEAQRKDRERQAKREERGKIQAFYSNRLQNIQSNINQGNTALSQLNVAIEAMEHVNAQEMYAANSPTASSQNLSTVFTDSIPENSGTASAYSWHPPTSGLYTTSGYAPMLGLGSSTPHRTTRGRSSSMLSNVSGFTQFSDDGPGCLLSSGNGKASLWEDAMEERKGSSGSGSTHGSVGDPKSPTVGNGKAVRADAGWF